MNGALCGPLANGFLAGDLDEDRRRGSRGFPAAGRAEPSDLQRAVDGDHRGAAGVDGLDDLGVVDALEVDGGDAEVAVSELALDDDERDAFAGHLDGGGVPQLVRREPASHSWRGGHAAQLGACRSGRPVPSERRAVDDAQQGTDWGPAPHVKPGLELLPAPGVHADLAAAAALAAPDQD